MATPARLGSELLGSSPIQTPGRAFQVELTQTLGTLALDVRFTLAAPWTVLFAPSGAGKSTVLRMIAGLDRPHTGRVASLCSSSTTENPEQVLTDTFRRIFVPAHRRRIHMVTQSPALFPHRSVLRNIEFGLSPIPEAQHALDEVLALCRVAHLTHKRPLQLSGGESQRVALARAIAGSGFDLLLLDEPFTGLETELRESILAALRARMRHRGIPVLQITHDVGEVFAAEAEVLRMESGRIVAQGPAAEVLGRERQALLDRLQP